MKLSAQINPVTVAVLAPVFNDSAIAVEVLNSAGISAVACGSLSELCECLNVGCGALIISEEAISDTGISQLQALLEKQDAWSDIPIILLTGNDIDRAIELFSRSGNISLLERPFSRLTLIRSVEVALRARQKQYEVRDLLRQLHRSKEEAERANLSKTQFLANMSHEIRTPIGAILGFTDLLKNPQNSQDENHNYMGIVERNSQQLLRLIDDILDLSKVEAGKMTFENIEFSLAEMLSDFNSIMSFKASEKGIAYNFNVHPNTPEFIISDPVRLKQILTNLVGNALKFTDKGYVELKVSYENGALKISVKDTGVGISKAQTKHLFQAFSQADTSTTRRFGGTGLGLILSRRLAESLGGTLSLAESAEGQGSTFYCEITAEVPSHSKTMEVKATIPAEKAKTSLTNLKVLLVEDSPDNQMLISTYLKKEGAEITTANNGAIGIDLALKKDFDVVLMDIQMPVLDGYEAARKLRSSHYGKPIIALTAHAMKEERVKCLESGFTEFLTKPIQRDLLIKTLSHYSPLN
jgi:hypothetical protein